jgi:AmmeMemoRadiSam system protein B
MELDGELRRALCTALEEGAGPGRAWAPDHYPDNTVEVLVPLARFLFPRARLLALRLPAGSPSYETGRLLAAAAGALGRKLVVAGSTDLTHYGRNYGFSPQGQGRRALDWVREVNDRRFIDAVLSGDSAAVLSRAEEERSACSAGAVLGTLGFVHGAGAQDGPAGNAGDSSGTTGVPALPRFLAYGTSAGLDTAGGIPDSFVGYAAIGWE